MIAYIIMDVREPATVAMAPRMAAIVRVLAGADASFTGRQVARLSGVSTAHTSRVLDRLVDHGVVTREVQGPSHLYRLNRDHLASAPLVDLADLRSRVIAKLRVAFQAFELPAEHVGFFGSAARGDGDIQSDLDVLIVRPADVEYDDQRWREQLFRTSQDVRRWTGNDLAWFELSRTELADAVHRREQIIAQWRHDVITLAGKELRVLLREVG